MAISQPVTARMDSITEVIVNRPLWTTIDLWIRCLCRTFEFIWKNAPVGLFYRLLSDRWLWRVTTDIMGIPEQPASRWRFEKTLHRKEKRKRKEMKFTHLNIAKQVGGLVVQTNSMAWQGIVMVMIQFARRPSPFSPSPSYFSCRRWLLQLKSSGAFNSNLVALLPPRWDKYWVHQSVTWAIQCQWCLASFPGRESIAS